MIIYRIAEDAMNRLADLYDAVMEDPDYLKASEELASIKSTLVGLIGKVSSKSDPLEPGDDTQVDIDESGERKRQPYKPSEEILKPDKKTQGFDMEKPNLDKVVSKLKKIMTHENNDEDRDEFEDDRISVRVTQIKEKSDDLYDKNIEKSFLEDNDENQLNEMNENAEMREATKKMESMVRKQLEDAGVDHEGLLGLGFFSSYLSTGRSKPCTTLLIFISNYAFLVCF